MQLVNFWLVAVAFLVTAFVQARVGNLRSIAVGVCVAGALASLAFAMLDVRTRRLIQVAEVALLGLENERVAAGASRETQLISAAATARLSWLWSYRIVIEGLQVTVAALFVLAGIYTAVGG